MKTIVLDDDPTGTQSATGVTVLLESNADLLAEALQGADSVYVQTNSRALPAEEAVALVGRIKTDGEAAAQRLGDHVRFVLRGDSTRRGPLRPGRRPGAPGPRERVRPGPCVRLLDRGPRRLRGREVRTAGDPRRTRKAPGGRARPDPRRGAGVRRRPPGRHGRRRRLG